MRKVFFTLRDFSKSGGGALRIRGLINALAGNGVSTTLVCTANKKTINVPSTLIKIDVNFTPLEKKIFFILLSFEITSFLIDVFFYKKLKKLARCIKENNLSSERMLFCEYIDNSIGYYLKRKRIIHSYSVDLHGVAHIEFANDSEMNILLKVYLWFKYKSSIRLDNKVLSNAETIIFASETMRQYFHSLYPDIEKITYKIIPYILTGSSKISSIDRELEKSIYNKYAINNDFDIVFFAGGFKKLGGVLDLVHAFNIVLKDKPLTKLFLLGDGPIKEQLVTLVKKYDIKRQVIFAGVVPYSELFTYQSLASVVVCPDTDNPYSNMIVHLKYFDSLLSGKVVINGSFGSVLELNQNEQLSVSFLPSNIDDLANKILYVLNNRNELEKKYRKNQEYVNNNFTYDKYFHKIIEIWDI